jgi:hypothetical protein
MFQFLKAKCSDVSGQQEEEPVKQVQQQLNPNFQKIRTICKSEDWEEPVRESMPENEKFP